MRYVRSSSHSAVNKLRIEREYLEWAKNSRVLYDPSRGYKCDSKWENIIFAERQTERHPPKSTPEQMAESMELWFPTDVVEQVSIPRRPEIATKKGDSVAVSVVRESKVDSSQVDSKLLANALKEMKTLAKDVKSFANDAKEFAKDQEVCTVANQKLQKDVVELKKIIQDQIKAEQLRVSVEQQNNVKQAPKSKAMSKKEQGVLLHRKCLLFMRFLQSHRRKFS
jgi:hypothetical protein